ncbi:MAG TPA: M20/M25/M40 family metallo-hydrolase [Longimicrobium sp.]|nr:M20/M25/M40 family metallo-hydrolase [Longimicrobium sp.]
MKQTMRGALIAIAAATIAAPALAQPRPARPVDWDALRAEATQVLSEYLRINTTNAPGNERAAAEFLKRILDREGIEAQILDEDVLGPGRANLYARLRGNGTKKAIALVHHMDVVPASAQHWTVDPFSGEVRDGYIWGRGAIDMKGDGVAYLMAMIALKRSGVPLTRDLVYIGNADEELGSTGATRFVERHADLLRDVEFLLTEGGDLPIENGRLQFYGVGVAEKRTLWQRLRVQGTPSHASRPTRQNPVPRLVAALARIAAYETPLEVTAGVEKYFRDIARNYEGERRAWLADVRTALADPRAREWILSDVYWNAILRNTISLTVVNGSNKTNVIPAEATAEIDIRLLPTADPDTVLARLKAIAADTGIAWTTIMPPKTPLENPVDTDLFRAIERAAHERDPGALVTTPMFTAASDRPTYRRLGIVTYGLDPFKVENAEHQKMMHGNDERLSIENLGWGTRFIYDILRYAQ